jgi:uncharacterized oxidoreductase
MKLEGKKILITGGGSGIGLELARHLAATNDVAIAGRSTNKLQLAHHNNPRLTPVQLDVTSEDSATAVIDWLRSEFGGLDLLVNSAGTMNGDNFGAPCAANSIAEQLDTNLGGPIRMTRLALPLLHQSPDAGIVYISSAVALAAVPQLSVYAAAKAGLHSFARSTRAGLADSNIHVFEVLPPAVDTDLASQIEGRKIAPSTVVDAIVRGISRNRQQIAIAAVRQLVPLARLAPRLADRIVQSAVQSSPTQQKP